MRASEAESPDIVALFERANERTCQIVSEVTREQLTLPTPCSEWDVSVLINHMIVSNQRSAAVAEGEPLERGGPIPNLLGNNAGEAYRWSADALKEAWRQPGRLDGRYPGPFGEMSGEAVLGLRLNETVLHGWDLAKATGQEPGFDFEVVRMAFTFARGTLGEVRPPGAPFGPPVSVPDETPEIDRFAAYMGRHP